jgi:hypothetical protein
MPYNSEHKGMADVMILEAAGIRLTDVAQVARAQSDAAKAEVQRQKLPQAERIAGMGTD